MDGERKNKSVRNTMEINTSTMIVPQFWLHTYTADNVRRSNNNLHRGNCDRNPVFDIVKQESGDNARLFSRLISD